jgi:hypothetical protein
MESIFAILILLADIYAILQIVQSSASMGSKVIWVLVVLLLPVIGLVAWYFAGPKS